MEDAKHGIPRIAQLRKARAAIRFLSADTLLAVGVSDTLRERLVEAEARVRALDAQRAAAAPSKAKKAGPPLPSPDALRAVLTDILGALTSPDGDAANRALRARFEPVVLTPDAAEWRVRTALKMNPAALIGRPGDYALGGCGGAPWRTVHLLVGEDRTGRSASAVGAGQPSEGAAAR